MGLENDFFSKVLGIVFFDPKSLSIDLLVMVPEFFKVTFDRFFSGPPKLSKMVQNGSGVSFDRFLGRPSYLNWGGWGGGLGLRHGSKLVGFPDSLLSWSQN